MSKKTGTEYRLRAGRVCVCLLALCWLVSCELAFTDDSQTKASGLQEVIRIDGAQRLWNLAENAIKTSNDEDAFVLLRCLTWLYADTEWATKARGRLTDERFVLFEITCAGLTLKTSEKQTTLMETNQFSWSDLKDKEAVTERLGEPDVIQNASFENSEEKWFYEGDRPVEILFRQERVRMIMVRDEDGYPVAGSVTFAVDMPVDMEKSESGVTIECVGEGHNNSKGKE